MISQSENTPVIKPSKALLSALATALQLSSDVLIAPPMVQLRPPASSPRVYSATKSFNPSAAASQSPFSRSTTDPSTAGPHEMVAPPKQASAISFSRFTFGMHMAFDGKAKYVTSPVATQ